MTARAALPWATAPRRASPPGVAVGRGHEATSFG